jgi:heme/copper-type cytochrome/quinol oxidase subunit 3
MGMLSFIATEAALFIALLLSYAYLSRGQPAWPPPPVTAPRLGLVSVMTLLLLTSSATLHLANRAIERGSPARLRLGLAVTVLLGAGFLVTQSFEYREYWKIVTPASNAYGSIFYTITGLHGAHVLLGLLLLMFVWLQARAGLFTESRHQPLRLVSWYWHFVDVVWIAIFSILYIAPRLSQ